MAFKTGSADGTSRWHFVEKKKVQDVLWLQDRLLRRIWGLGAFLPSTFSCSDVVFQRLFSNDAVLITS